MTVVATSVFLLFALIVLGFILGKRNIIHKESNSGFSTLVLKVTMPVTVFCSIIDQDRSQLFAYGIQTFVTIILVHLCAFLIGLLLVRVMKVADLDQGVWIYCMLFSNNGFMGIPLALSIFGGKGMFLMALGNVVSNFSDLFRWDQTAHLEVSDPGKVKYPENGVEQYQYRGNPWIYRVYPADPDAGCTRKTAVISVKYHKRNVHAGGRTVSFQTSGKGGFPGSQDDTSDTDKTDRISATDPWYITDRPGCTVDTLKNVMILTAALPASSAQSMITEQYGTNTTGAGRSVFMTTLFSVITVPVIMMIAFA